MPAANEHSHDGSGGESSSASSGARFGSPARCHETVDPVTREALLEQDRWRCQVCGRRGPGAGGLATLHAHHIDRDPKEIDVHAIENLTTLCRPCHRWLHDRPTVTDAPVELSDGDLSVLLPQDFEILRVLDRGGPARTGEIAAALTADLTVSAVRERLWVLMGLDHKVQGREAPLVDKDVQTGQWGFPGDIETSARGHIPSDPGVLLQRMEDEQVRRALARGCDRQAVMDVLGVSRRSTFYKEKRAQAYDFPLDAFNRGGRPPTKTTTQPGAGAGSDGQQGLDDATPDVEGELGRVETWGSSS
ncbi:HNH endonuclease [Halobacterium sp. R2-5]|uniref:HNH endonuclease n=1 Tax=Halobacterium sp. R2-5 TaxID=2715751 RepID=UPI00141E6FFC|nr:HNH endonuclease [Halobacterium sp. R2-5]NIC00955.1 HNH endonuclease [Halobacterium sp. R2-5]